MAQFITTGNTYKSKNKKWLIAVSLGGEKHTFSNFDECTAWLNINIIPLILETDCIHQNPELRNLGLNLSKAEDCINILRNLGFVVAESEKGKWLITSPLNSIIIHAHSIGDLHRLINEHYA